MRKFLPAIVIGALLMGTIAARADERQLELRPHAVADIDGDARDDVLLRVRDRRSGELWAQARSGADGTVLWTRALPADTALEPGTDLRHALALTWHIERVPGTPLPTTGRLQMLDLSDGRTRWTFDPGADHADALSYIAMEAKPLPDATGDAIGEVLVSIHRSEPVVSLDPPLIGLGGSLSICILDGGSGEKLGQCLKQTVSEGFYTTGMLPDMDGDGRFDIVARLQTYGGTRLVAWSTTTGTLWSIPVDETYRTRSFAVLPGSSRHAILFGGHGGAAIFSSDFAVRDAGDGSLLWTGAQGSPAGIGDVDADGRQDVSLLDDPEGDGTYGIVTRSGLNGALLAASPPVYQFGRVLHDLTGDGITDVITRSSAGDGSPRWTVVDGRTASAVLHTPDDGGEIRSVIRDATGDGESDLLEKRYDGFELRTIVRDGRTLARTWSAPYADIQIALDASGPPAAELLLAFGGRLDLHGPSGLLWRIYVQDSLPEP
ncbi:MAG TPA: hypothetical protein VGB64_16005 [Actinomycetota bacterium]